MNTPTSFNFLSSHQPDAIEQAITNYFRKIKIEPMVNPDKYKMNLRISDDDACIGQIPIEPEANKYIEIDIRLCKYNDRAVLVHVLRKHGDKSFFYKMMQMMTELINYFWARSGIKIKQLSEW